MIIKTLDPNPSA